jgi:Fur family ferric uptake transcriptional regulator
MSQRRTRQKDAVLEVLGRAEAPLAPPEILSQARKIVPTIGLATVYRILKRLLDDGTVTVVQLPGEPPLYELAGKGHHHFFRCRQCGSMYEVGGCNELLRRLVPRGFRLEEHEVYLLGKCASCAK